MRTLTFLLLVITGLALALPGAYLAMLGGSYYYVTAGVLILVSAFLVRRGSSAGIGLFWLTACIIHDSANGHILSARMAALFHLPNYVMFIVVTVFIGGLVGGLSAWAGALIRPKND